jgi:hypothetical protein
MKANALPKNYWGEVIMVTGFFYRVDFGPGVNNRIHFVQGEVCNCRLQEHCPATTVVKTYLFRGGEPAPNPPDGFYAVLPYQCPICGAEVKPDPGRNSPVRGTGWQCLADKGHYWQSLGRKKQPECNCFAYPFAHQPGSGICRSGKQVEQDVPCEILNRIPVPA